MREEITYKGNTYRRFIEEGNEVPVEERNGRWYIASGYAGYNSPANNGFGYVSEAKALASIRRYQNR